MQLHLIISEPQIQVKKTRVKFSVCLLDMAKVTLIVTNLRALQKVSNKCCSSVRTAVIVATTGMLLKLSHISVCNSFGWGFFGGHFAPSSLEMHTINLSNLLTVVCQ